MTSEASTQASLLKYIQSSCGAAPAALSLFVDTPPYRDRAYPFAVLDDNDPFSRIIVAKFITDTGSLLKEVCLLTQKDHYSTREHDLGSATNTDLDISWQNSYADFKSEAPRRAQLTLSCQTDEQGRLARMAPLFFCRGKRSYFHPVCPSCGISLELCTDDNLLKINGLASYSGSAKRYLHCAVCCARGLQEFYLFERDAADPITIKDRWSLIDRFRLVKAEMVPEGDFPCAGCPEHDDCYGPAQNARARITPFSFYPFYFLMYEAPSLHALDFLDLVSGASCEEIAARLDPVAKVNFEPVPRGEGLVPKVQNPGSVPGEAVDGLRDILDRYIGNSRKNASEHLARLSVEPDQDEVATIILTPDRAEFRGAMSSADDISTETVLLGSAPPVRQPTSSGPQVLCDESILETVCLASRRKDLDVSAVAQLSTSRPWESLQEKCSEPGADQLHETIIAPRPSQQNGCPAHSPEQNIEMRPPVAPVTQSDLLGETVVIQPQKGRSAKVLP
jgi:hypothetical protein